MASLAYPTGTTQAYRRKNLVCNDWQVSLETEELDTVVSTSLGERIGVYLADGWRCAGRQTLWEDGRCGYFAVENRVRMYDLHATFLHLLAFNYTQLTYRHARRDFRFTDANGESYTKSLCYGYGC